jgi:cytidylate kinase
LIEKGNPVILSSLLRDIQERDARDGGRTTAPLRPAADAVILDTTGMSIADSIAFLLQRYRALEAGGNQ